MRKINSEEDVIYALAKFLNENHWEILACHPPGGHTSFSILNGRRSKGVYMPDIAAVQKNKKRVPIVIIAECKDDYNKSNTDIKKLKNISDIHADWISFRLQNHLNISMWKNRWRKKLQKVIAAGNIDNLETIKQEIKENTDLIIINIEEDLIQFFVGKESPAKKLFKKLTLNSDIPKIDYQEI